MTNDRLNEILDEQKIVRYRGHFLKAMKQAVNEVLEEVIANTDQFDHIHKDEILKLKVK